MLEPVSLYLTVFSVDSLQAFAAGGSVSAVLCYWPSPTTLAVAVPSTVGITSSTNITINDGVLARAATQRVLNTLPLSVFPVTPRRVPPTVFNAAMANSGGAIVVVFSAASSSSFGSGANVTDGLVSCDRVVENGNLGMGATCLWQSATVLLVQLGAAVDTSTLLVPMDTVTVPSVSTVVDCRASGASTLVLRAGAVTAVRGGFATTARTCVNVALPAAPTPPMPIIAGSGSLGVCDAVNFDARCVTLPVSVWWEHRGYRTSRTQGRCCAGSSPWCPMPRHRYLALFRLPPRLYLIAPRCQAY